MKKFPSTRQLGIKDCGPASLKIIAKWYGKNYDLNYLRQKCNLNKTGVSLLGISEAAESIGFRTLGVLIDLESLRKAIESGPCIIHWKQSHFVVLYKCKTSLLKKKRIYHISDPARGLVALNEEAFLEGWKSESPKGYALLFEPRREFYLDKNEGEEGRVSFTFLLPYFIKYKIYFGQIFLGMLIGSVLSLIGPFLTQALVDTGINGHNLNFVYLILAAQLAIFVGGLLIEIVRSWILIHIGTRINVSMVSEFFHKILNMPIKFYEQYVVGDLMQRIGDHSRVEQLLTVNSLSTIFSLINVLVLGSILFFYSKLIFVVFFVGALLGLGWVFIFLKQRRNIDFRFFEAYSKNNNKVLEILNAVQDIKISNAIRQKRWEWEKVQGQVYLIKLKALRLAQVQGTGNLFITRLVGILVTIIAAKQVIDGSITLGTMFAINMIIGQISNPIGQLVGFVSTVQDAKIGLERISDILNKEDEDSSESIKEINIPERASLKLENLSFHYGSRSSAPVLENLNLNIEHGKVTAIVGASGSGKTTLIKLLLKFYEPTGGSIQLGPYNFNLFHNGKWREHCGVVMQEGQLLSGTILDNITLGQEVDFEKVVEAAKLANIDSFIDQMPMGYSSEIGPEGSQISIGQKQRLLLARAIYKDPEFIFLDEATSSLDAENEKIIIRNLAEFLKNRTAVIVAHRLSTVRDADTIIVLGNGRILESGNHDTLVAKKGSYYNLVRNQLELGS